MKGKNTFTFTKEVTGEIVQIPVDMLIPHPSNPRHDDGKDLEELTASIKERGILQNLTVVPRDDGKEGYLVVIGHRRLQAAKKAGLQTVPAIIADMTIEQQVRTMLIENMQRSDLTPMEQAEGFQMMFDFGDSVRTIAKKTGFSETTVRHRLKIAELDKEALKNATDLQITLDALYKLEELTDLNERNRILALYGTNDYAWQLNQALRKQTNKETAKRIREIMEKLGVPKVENLYREAMDIESVSEDSDEEKIREIVSRKTDPVYYISYGSWFEFKIGNRYVEEDDEEDEEDTRAWREEMEKRKEKLDADAKTAHVCRQCFIETFTQAQAKKLLPEIADALMDAASCSADDYWSYRWMKSDVTKIQEMRDEGLPAEVILLRMAYASFHDYNQMTWDWAGEFNGMKKPYEKLMQFLKAIGYKPSAVEASLMDGTHPEFKQPEDEEDAEAGEDEE